MWLAFPRSLNLLLSMQDLPLAVSDSCVPFRPMPKGSSLHAGRMLPYPSLPLEEIAALPRAPQPGLRALLATPSHAARRA